MTTELHVTVERRQRQVIVLPYDEQIETATANPMPGVMTLIRGVADRENNWTALDDTYRVVSVQKVET